MLHIDLKPCLGCILVVSWDLALILTANENVLIITIANAYSLQDSTCISLQKKPRQGQL